MDDATAEQAKPTVAGAAGACELGLRLIGSTDLGGSSRRRRVASSSRSRSIGAGQQDS